MLIVRGAREHNLKGVDLDLPAGQVVALCGPSGSGKSSLAFDTLFAEGQRRYLQALGLSSRADLPPPRVDRLDGLPPTLALRQRVQAPDHSARLVEVAEAAPALRLLFGRSGELHCPACGRPVRPTSHDGIVAALLEAPEGARVLIEAPLTSAAGVLDEVRRAGFSRVRVDGEVMRAEGLTLPATASLRVVVDRVKVSADRRARLADSVRLAAQAGRGVVVAVVDGEEHTWVDRPYCPHDDQALPPLEPRLLSRRSQTGGCPSCAGSGCEACDQSGLSSVARAVTWRGFRLPDLWAMSIDELCGALPSQGEPAEQGALDELRRHLSGLQRLGLGPLPLSRRALTLSAGERQRVRLARTVAAALGGVLYVLDEPAAGLDEGWIPAVLGELTRLRDQGAMVLVVSHQPTLLLGVDRVVEFGPGAGAAGGQLLYDGPPGGLVSADTPTGRWLSGRSPLPPARGRAPGPWVGAAPEGLPTGVLAALVGPSGSGKSRRMRALAERAVGVGGIEQVVAADRPAGRSRRSTAGTYVGVWGVLRSLLAQTEEARVRGFDASTFSLNVRGGRCEACKGDGVLRVALEALPDVEVGCEVCGGRRFARDVLDVRWRGLDPSQLLEADAATLRPILSGHPKLEAGLGALVRAGLGYVPLGMATDALSGGEARRLALARELVRRPSGVLYLLDDTTVGLHRADVQGLIEVMQELVEAGGTVWLATHDDEVAACADHVVRVLSPDVPSLVDDAVDNLPG